MFCFAKLWKNTRSRGDIAECCGEEYLQRQGLTPVAKNYQCRCGEIDLIMKDHDTLVFIEVRYRQSSHFGLAFETVNAKKQQKIVKTARYYLHRYQLTENIGSRFDVLGIQPRSSVQELQTARTRDLQFSWIQNAFYAE